MPLRFASAAIVAALSLAGPARPGGGLAAQTGVSISNATASEAGTGGTSQIVFKVRVTRDTLVAAGQVAVQYSAVSGTATVATTQCGPGIDIVLPAGTLFIPANASSGNIVGTICEDALDEADAETFTVMLTGATGSSFLVTQATGTVLDDDPTPSLQVADASAPEGAPGEQRVLGFNLALSAPSGRDVSVSYAVAAGAPSPAQGGAACGGAVDFVLRSGTETFPAGTTSRQVAVTLCGDGLFEPDERIALTLSAPINATIADGTGIGSITNDDAQPVITVVLPGQGTVTEGSGANQAVSVRVSLSAANHSGASVTFTRSGTAVAGQTCAGAVDVIGLPNTIQLTWPANDNADRTIDFTVCGDTSDDDDDTVQLDVTGGSVVAIAPGSQSSRLVILDDDPPPGLSVVDGTVTEGATAQVNATLSVASNRDVDVLLTTSELDGRALRQLAGRVSVTPATQGSSCGGDVDFVAASHRLRIPAGSLTAPLPLRVTTCRNVDGSTGSLTSNGSAETFLVTASSPTNATLARAVGAVVIQDP